VVVILAQAETPFHNPHCERAPDRPATPVAGGSSARRADAALTRMRRRGRLTGAVSGAILLPARSRPSAEV